MTLAFLLCIAMAAAIAGCLLTGSVVIAWFLVVVSAAWEPANNHHLEGAVLLTIQPHHGLTVADLYGLAGFGIATLTLLTSARLRTDIMSGVGQAATCAVIFGIGVAAAWIIG